MPTRRRRAAPAGSMSRRCRTPNSRYAAAATMRWATKFARNTFPSCPPTPAFAIASFAMMPTAENGERLPAFAPLATMSAVRKTGTPVRAAIVMASGAISATLEMLPGPTLDSAQATAKNTIGMTRTLPRAMRTAPLANRSSVPFVSASANSWVTPASVTKSDTGKPRITTSGVRSAT